MSGAAADQHRLPHPGGVVPLGCQPVAIGARLRLVGLLGAAGEPAPGRCRSPPPRQGQRSARRPPPCWTRPGVPAGGGRRCWRPAPRTPRDPCPRLQLRRKCRVGRHVRVVRRYQGWRVRDLVPNSHTLPGKREHVRSDAGRCSRSRSRGGRSGRRRHILPAGGVRYRVVHTVEQHRHALHRLRVAGWASLLHQCTRQPGAQRRQILERLHIGQSEGGLHDLASFPAGGSSFGDMPP